LRKGSVEDPSMAICTEQPNDRRSRNVKYTPIDVNTINADAIEIFTLPVIAYTTPETM
jgi:hypothetical protein